MATQKMPQLKADLAVINNGMNLVVSPMFAQPGTARMTYNYEYSVTGGIDRIRGIEPYSGQASPSAASYVYFQCAGNVDGVSVGQTVTGAVSGATGVVCLISGAFITLTAVTGTFQAESLLYGTASVGTVINLAPSITGFQDNLNAKAAADYYQSLIGPVPGSGPVRGIEIIDNVVYAWRDSADGTAGVIYQATTSGWSAVTLYQQISFTGGSTAYADGNTLTQGGVSATIMRVVLETGEWNTSNAAGRFIIAAPTGGSFSAGAAAGGGVCTLSGASTQITLLPGGKVRGFCYNFSASNAAPRMYGCDGVNAEFEFDGSVLVPLNTGMGSIRASVAYVHLQTLFFGYRGSLMASGIGLPYAWTPLLGAGELGTGDTITNLVAIGGGSDTPALMVLCQKSNWVLYGSSTADFQLTPLSKVSGAQFDSAHDIGGVTAMDSPGVVRYPPTRNFGNFSWDTVSLNITPYIRGKTVAASVYTTSFYKLRYFFTDGTAISGLPTKDSQVGAIQGMSVNQFVWSVINYGINIVCAECDQINGFARTFYGDDQGWVYEADVGRSFAGQTIEYGIQLLPLSQQSPMMLKTYWHSDFEVNPQSACTIYTSANFDDGEGNTDPISTPTYGAGGYYDLTNYNACFFDAGEVQRQTVPYDNLGTDIAITIYGNSDNELTHQIEGLTVVYTPRRIKR